MRIFLSMIFMLGFATPAFCGVGNVDNREYVNWNSEPYNKFVRFTNATSSCTAQYVAPNIILTAAHCFNSNTNYITRSDDKEFELELLRDGWANLTNRTKCSNSNDWAVFLIKDPDGYKDYFKFDAIKQPHIDTNVISAGFGGLRILLKDEITNINKAINDNLYNLKKTYDEKGISVFSQQLQNLIKEPPYNVTNPLFGDGKKFKAETCTVQLIPELKYNADDRGQPLLSSTCDVWGGNSGGAVIDRNTHNVYGVGHCADYFHFGGENYGVDGTFVPTSQFQDELAQIIESNPPKHEPEPEPEPEITEPELEQQPSIAELIPTSPQIKPEDLIKPEDIHYLEEKLETQDQELQEVIPDLRNLVEQGRLLQFLGKLADREETADRLEELKKKYQEAKEREQSDANRALTAVTTAMTGLGTMAAASALAERKADEKAEADMRQYLTTFECEYGKGNIVKTGNEEITIPGGNELSKYYAEYKSLADNLKTTKTALGLRAGIESETLYNQAQTGLYQYSTAERQTGAYASLSRALTDPESEDAAAWAKQQKDTKTKLIAGTAVAGVGVVGGIVGNQIINGRDDDISTLPDFDATDIGNRVENVVRNKNISNIQNPDGTPLPSSQSSAVLEQPWKWLFKTTNSTTFDGETRTVKGKSVTAEDTIVADVRHVIDFLNQGATAQTQCVTVDSRPKNMANIVMQRYSQELNTQNFNFTIQYQLNQSSHLNQCDDDAPECEYIVTHVYNRPCDGDVWTPTRVKSETKTVPAPVNANTVNNPNAIIEQWKNEFRQKYSSYEITEDNSAKLFEFIEGDENHPDYINLRTTCQQLIDQGTRYDWHIAGDKKITIDGYGTVIVNKHICDGYH